jgi:uncharacterized protein YukE
MRDETMPGSGQSGQITIDPQTFKVDLGDLASSIALVQSRAGSMEDEYRKITQQFQNLSVAGTGMTASAWSSPAGDTFVPVEAQLRNAMSTLQQLLNEIVSRMQQSYNNYVQTEEVNIQNLTS